LKIGTKLTLALAAPLVGLMVLFGWIEELHNREILETGLEDERREIARSIQTAAEDSIAETTPKTAVELVDKASSFMRLIGLRLFDEEGRLVFESSALAGVPATNPSMVRKAIEGQEPSEVHGKIRERSVAAFVFPISGSDAKPIGAVQAFQEEAFIEEAARAARRSIILLTGTMIFAASIIVYLVIRTAVGRPIAGLAKSFADVASGDLAARAPVRSDDELGNLAREFNTMCERLEDARKTLIANEEERRRIEASLRNAERLASVGRLAAGLAHEIGTPLGVIVGRAESLRRKLAGNERAQRSLQIIAGQIERISTTVKGMLDYSRARTVSLAPTALTDVLGKVLEFLEDRFQNRSIEVETDFPRELPRVLADADRLYEVFLNLAMNAIDAMPEGGRLAVRVGTEDRPQAERPALHRAFAVVSFEDQGCGISQKDLERIFDPFFTTKEVGKGTGLGLSISYGIVREHGGWIEAESAVGAGTRITVLLPLEPSAQVAAAASNIGRSDVGSSNGSSNGRNL
jgi:signal transduction histidine kinase